MKDLKSVSSDLSSLSKDELKSYISQWCDTTVKGIKCVASGVRAWSDAGYDIAELRSEIPFVDVFWKIGCGQISAELFFHYGHRSKLFSVLSRLPQPIQEELGSSPHRIPVSGHDGEERMIDPREMTPAQIHVVFDVYGGRIRTPAEQRSIIEEQRTSESTEAIELSEEIVPGKNGVTLVAQNERVFLTWRQVESLEKLRVANQQRHSKKATTKSK